MSEQWIDLLITDQDITLDAAGMPEYVSDRASINQDIKHMILETGLLIDLIGERSNQKWLANINQIENLIEEDVRIIPGTVTVERPTNETLVITADSELGPLLWPFSLEEINGHK